LAKTSVFQPYFWATQHGAELDLFLEHDGHRVGVEFKCADAPVMTKSMRIATEDLKLEELIVIYPGAISYPLDDNVLPWQSSN
jgi:predicted AAA+ superfamily ATPase